MTQITMAARELLAAEYDRIKQPWFAIEIRKGVSKQFDSPLKVITGLLQAQQHIRDEANL